MTKEHYLYSAIALVGSIAVALAIILTLFFLQGYGVKSVTETKEDVQEDIAENITTTEVVETPATETVKEEVKTDPALETFTLPAGTASYVLSSVDGDAASYVIDVIDAKTLETTQSAILTFEVGFRPEDGSRNGYYLSDSVQFDSSGRVYFLTTDYEPMRGNATKATWRISRATNAGTGMTLIESKGNLIDQWLVSKTGEYIVYSVSSGKYSTGAHTLFRYDTASGTNTKITMNTPYDSDYDPFDNTYGPKFIDAVGDELYGVYRTERNNEGFMYFRVNTENGIYTQTATTVIGDKEAIFPSKDIAIYWEPDYNKGVLDKLRFLKMDLTKGTSFDETTLLQAESNQSSIWWNPSGSRATFVTLDNPNGENLIDSVNVYDVDNGKDITTLVRGNNVGSYGWFNDTEFLYYDHTKSVMGVYNVDTGENRLLPGGLFTPNGVTYVK